MATYLKSAHPTFQILFAHNDDMAIGAIKAIEEAGLKPGQDIKKSRFAATGWPYQGNELPFSHLQADVLDCHEIVGPGGAFLDVENASYLTDNNLGNFRYPAASRIL